MLNIKFSKDNFPTEEGLYLVKHDATNIIDLIYFNGFNLKKSKGLFSYSEKILADGVDLTSI